MFSTATVLALHVTLMFCIGVSGTVELLSNADFEDSSLGKWFAHGRPSARIYTVTDAISGHKSVRTSNRGKHWHGPVQSVDVKSDTSYNASGYVKILNNKPGKLSQVAKMTLQITMHNGETIYPHFTKSGFLTAADGWVRLQGTLHTTSQQIAQAFFKMEGPDPEVDFLVDAMSLTEVTSTRSRQEADARIEKYRMSKVTLNIHLSPGLDPRQYEITIRQMKHSFPFGAVVSTGHVVSPHFKEYRDLLFKMFNWFTVPSFCWHQSEGGPLNLSYTTAVRAMDTIRQNGFPVTAHPMFAGRMPKYVQGEIKQLSATDLNRTIFNRAQYLSRITQGKAGQWILYDGVFLGDFYQQKTGDPDLMKKVTSFVHRADPDVKLFLNTRHVLTLSYQDLTQSYLDLAREYQREGVGLYGLGVQGFFRDALPPELTLLQSRLDILSQAGLPIWITELDVVSENETLRADWYEAVWRLCYSHPAVEGIVISAFWDRTNHRPGSALVNGNGFYINEAGARWLQLTQNEWSTYYIHPVSDGTSKVIRGFHGEYDVIVKKNGEPIKFQKFSLGKSPAVVTVIIDGSEGIITIPARPVISQYLKRKYHHRTYNVKQEKRIQIQSTTSATLQCVNRLSNRSAIGDDEKAMISCEGGEVMTSCSVMTEDRSYLRDGEKFVYTSGQMRCVAVNSRKSTSGVFAQARCCKLTGLRCEYQRSGPPPEPLQDGDRAETTCSAGKTPTGCMSHTYWLDVMDGAFHTQTSCIAQVNALNQFVGGVRAYAICCSSPGLQCRVIQSEEGARSRGSKVTIQCTASEVMVGCSVFSEDGRTAGARITDDAIPLCEGVSGADRFPGERGVQVSAVCCRV